MKKLLFISLAVVLLTSLAAGSLTFTGCANGKAITNVIKIDSGYISGTVIGEPGKEVHIYRGIPYAAPPVGELRWKPPQPVTPWSNIRECTEYCTAAPQQGGPPPEIQEQSEDCLYLNIETPVKTDSKKLPVMVFFHGGAFSALTANDPMYNGYRLPQKGIVQVSVNERLGVFGLFTHPLLDQESAEGVSGNYMLLDQISALKWIQKNIAAFGGDPNNVTIFGESGGGWKVSAMIASPLAKGLFHRAIIESGAGLNGKPLKDMEAMGKQLFEKLGVSTLAEARALNWDKIMAANKELSDELKAPPYGPWDAVVDGWFLPDNALNLYAQGKFNAVPLITCANGGELASVGKMLDMISYYKTLLIANSKADARSYACIFDRVPAGWKAQGGICAHTMELFYVFGNLEFIPEHPGWLTWSKGMQPKSVTSDDPGVNEVDVKVADETMSMWAQFASTGDPNVKGLISWPEYKSDADKYLYVEDPLQVKTGFSHLMDDIPASQ